MSKYSIFAVASVAALALGPASSASAANPYSAETTPAPPCAR